MLYTSLENKKIKDLNKLKTKKYLNQSDIFLVEGKHLVLEAFKTGYLDELLLEENENFKLDIKTSYLSSNVIKHLSNLETPSTIMGICHKKETNEIFDSKILILDDIQDPGNLGTIIRSCVAFNIDTLILSKNTVYLYNDKVIRSSQGMNFHLNIVIEELDNIIPILKKRNYKIIGTKVTDGKNVKTLEKIDKFAIIMGNEGNGINPEIIKQCDDYLYIKMNEKCESLNVGVAASIILYQLDK